jgi:hypothetical protein
MRTRFSEPKAHRKSAGPKIVAPKKIHLSYRARGGCQALGARNWARVAAANGAPHRTGSTNFRKKVAGDDRVRRFDAIVAA